MNVEYAGRRRFGPVIDLRRSKGTSYGPGVTAKSPLITRTVVGIEALVLNSAIVCQRDEAWSYRRVSTSKTWLWAASRCYAPEGRCWCRRSSSECR